MNKATSKFINKFLYAIEPKKNRMQRAKFYRIKTDKNSIMELVEFVNKCVASGEELDYDEIAKKIGCENAMS